MIISPITKGRTKKIGDIPLSLVSKNIFNQYGIDPINLFEGIEVLSIMECEDTGYRFYYPSSLAGEESLYNIIGQQQHYYPESRWEYALALNYIKPTDHVLEIGAGYGFFLDLLKKKEIHYQAIELNTHAIRIAEQRGHTISNILIQDFGEQHQNEVNIVCFFQVLEHIADVSLFLRSALRSLKKGGLLILSVPNNDAFIMKYDYLLGAGNVPPHHIGLWTKGALQQIANHFDLNLVTLKEQPLSTSLIGYFYTLKMRKLLGRYANAVVYPTRWLLKIILKKRTHKIPGPTIFAVFEKR